MVELKKILKNRSTIMGIACLFIMIFHSNLSNLNGTFIKRYLYIGVDIFLFVSGIGIAQSLNKNPSKKEFYKRRFKRIVPVTLPLIIILGFIMHIYVKDFTTIDFYKYTFYLNNLIPVGNFFAFLWYLPTIMIYYLLSPFIFNYYKKRKSKVKATIVLLSIAVFAAMFTIPTGFLTYFYFVTNRFLIYTIGIIFGIRITEDKKMSLWELIFYITMSIFGVVGLLYLSKHYVLGGDFLKMICFVPIVIIICISIAYLKDYLVEKNFFFKGHIFDYLGKYTLVIYTTHEFFLYLIKAIGYHYDRGVRFINNPYIYSLFVGIFTIVFSIIYSKLIDKIIND